MMASGTRSSCLGELPRAPESELQVFPSFPPRDSVLGVHTKDLAHDSITGQGGPMGKFL